MNDQIPKRLSVPDSALDLLLDSAYQIEPALRFSFLSRCLNKLSFAKAINDNDVKHTCATVAAKLRLLHRKPGGTENSNRTR